ncbi:DUF2303 family protein [Fodinicurvata sp. EGI_FJ10296]|uniref:DUF2303 family protein n=1 Tax=Fodinicurvata sp. EGI_FJ10296 TaxID=3231908 RepID=UPI00345114BA
MKDIDKSDLQAIRDLAVASFSMEESLEFSPFKLIPDGFKAINLESFRHCPARKRGVTHVADVESFNRYFNDHSNQNSRIYADLTKPEFVGVIDDHPAGPEINQANWGDHTVVLRPARSLEWKRWTDYDRKVMTQLDFDRFLQENAADIVEGDVEDVVGTARCIQVRESHIYWQEARLQEGTTETGCNIETEGTMQGSENRRVPFEFCIRAPIFLNGIVYTIRCFLRYRKTPDGVMFFYEMHRREPAELFALKVILTEIQHGLPGIKDDPDDVTNIDPSGRKPFHGTKIRPILGRPPSDRG